MRWKLTPYYLGSLISWHMCSLVQVRALPKPRWWDLLLFLSVKKLLAASNFMVLGRFAWMIALETDSFQFLEGWEVLWEVFFSIKTSLSLYTTFIQSAVAIFFIHMHYILYLSTPLLSTHQLHHHILSTIHHFYFSLIFYSSFLLMFLHASILFTLLFKPSSHTLIHIFTSYPLPQFIHAFHLFYYFFFVTHYLISIFVADKQK